MMKLFFETHEIAQDSLVSNVELMKESANIILAKFQGDMLATFPRSVFPQTFVTRKDILLSLNMVLQNWRERSDLMRPSERSEVYRKISSALDMRADIAALMRLYNDVSLTSDKKKGEEILLSFRNQVQVAAISAEVNDSFKPCVIT